MRHYLFLFFLIKILLVYGCFATTNNQSDEGFNTNNPTSLCSFHINNNYYDLSNLTLTDGTSYKASYNIFKFDFFFNVCGRSSYCDKYSSTKNVQSCTTFPSPVEIGNTQTESVVENSNGITISYTHSTSNHKSICKTTTNQLEFTCDNSTDFHITGMIVNNICSYTVNIRSRYACPQSHPIANPSRCIFGNTDSVIDLSPLIIPNNSFYTAPFVNNLVYFSVCGSSVDKCKDYKEEDTGMGPYQSCQVLEDENLAVQTGKTTSLQTTISYNRAILNYTSSSFPCAKGYYRYNILQLDCDPTTDFNVVSSYESQLCVYNININSKYACTLS